ncbi:LpxL/LpxP family Kdo(2)-lipid IV(A) lauroyl/palmitoleoyl acyltransferase [Zophobihabitans entericus]|uniref:Lipid A biosynthesis acyltransferase n=1 Tax=Zophobihabitans entericus TaxID=1635327 RepID=A0A6G9ICX6_9GAMM|nr:LpxL/LpxP family Kdo(2)-lipid IV(A) lauroyl/palmitoleoyl acyltransferase [Zophobihabitans entericus]QIQ21669.1 LpxL/LpxP family Kdo(2)-lipid IV(A) lauroyl/palmitoleoyl acyltransferase [Zophobihabitans entericus]
MTPHFSLALLHPKYWLTWFGIGTLYLFVQLPYPVLFRFGKMIGRFSKKFLKRRVKIAERNIRACFPHLSQQEIDQLIINNFESVGMGLIETGMAWFWSDKRIRKWSKVEGLEQLDNAVLAKKGVLLIGVHFLTLELGGRILGQYHEGVGVYRAHNNRLLDWVQLKGRLKSNKAFIDRSDTRKMIRALKQGDILWYAPDHDYGIKNSVFAPFFAVSQAATTIGTHLLIKSADPTIIAFTPLRNHDGSGYTISISDKVETFISANATETATHMNQIIEKEIMKAPDLYMWLHRRFKTRPKDEPSIYIY